MGDGAAAVRRVFVFGSANHDHTLTVTALPQAGQTILAHTYSDGFGGKGANQAIAAAIADASVLFVGAVGLDDQGDDVVTNLTAHGIDTRWTTRVADVPTGRAFVIVDAHGANEIIVAAGANAALTAADADAALTSVTPRDVIVVQCEIPATRVEQIIRGAAARGAYVIVNLAPFTRLPSAVLHDVDLLVVNESEARSLAETERPAGELAAAVAELSGCACVVTLGGRGSVHAAPGGRTTTVDAVEVTDVVDTTGAGDVYVGSLAASVSRDYDVASAMRAASAAAAVSVAHRGAQSLLPHPVARAVS